MGSPRTEAKRVLPPAKSEQEDLLSREGGVRVEGVKSINEQQSYARDWEWVEARERESGRKREESFFFAMKRIALV